MINSMQIECKIDTNVFIQYHCNYLMFQMYVPNLLI